MFSRVDNVGSSSAAENEQVSMINLTLEGKTYYIIENYQKSISCSHCHSRFNPACSKHYDIYFAK